MITFSKKSWHYRLNKFAMRFDFGFNNLDSNSLFCYIFSTLYNIVILLSFGILSAVAAVVIGAGAGSKFFDYSIHEGTPVGELLLSIILGWSLILVMLVAVVILLVAIVIVGDTIKNHKHKQTKFGEVIKNLKTKMEKFFPTIEFKD